MPLLPLCYLFDKDLICNAVDLQPREHVHTPQVVERAQQKNVLSQGKGKVLLRDYYCLLVR